MNPVSKSWKKRIGACRDEESGAISLLNMYLVLTLAILGGIGIDMANLISARNHLQVAADVAAHAAIASYKNGDTPAEARAKALKYAQANMPSGGYGTVLEADDIYFGAFYRTTTEFQKNDKWVEASMVVTSRLSENANPVSSLLLRLAGFNTFDVRSEAVFINGDTPCVGAGFYAEGRVDMQSGNDFTDGFCVRSNSQVEFNNGNTFEYIKDTEYPVIVSMPLMTDLIIPSSGYDSNPGIEDAMRDGGHTFDVDQYITDVIAGIFSTETDPMKNPFTRSYGDPNNQVTVVVGSTAKVTGKDKKDGTAPPIGPNNCPSFEAACLEQGAINLVNCGGSDLTLPGELFENVVLYTTCNLKFENGASLSNATFITTSEEDSSISTPQGLIIGSMTTCTGVGGAQIITRGGMKSAAKWQLFGGQIIAAKDVNFAANAGGFVGASVIAGGEIDGTSNSSFQGCPGMVLPNFGIVDPQPARMAY